MNTVRARQPHVRRTRLSNQFVASPTKRYCPLQISNPGPGNARSETCARRAQVPRCAPGASGRAFCMCVCVRVRDPPQVQRGSLSRSWHVIAKPEWAGRQEHASRRDAADAASSRVPSTQSLVAFCIFQALIHVVQRTEIQGSCS